MGNYVNYLTGNQILNAAIVAWFIAQALKVILPFVFNKKLNIARFFGAGGMPSSHTSSLVAMTTAVADVCGTHSTEFAIALVITLVVMYDATGVRRAAGEQAKVLNYMMDNWTKTTPEIFSKDLKELLGHTPLEVLAGAVLGILVGIILK